jgi:hypothetical protein
MRRSIDDAQLLAADLPPSDDELEPVSWAVAICDDYDDAECRVLLTVEAVGAAGTGWQPTSHPNTPVAFVARCTTPCVSSAKTPAAERAAPTTRPDN